MNREEKIKRFENKQLEILLNDLQDVDKFTAFKNGAFKYELGKYQANLLVNCIKKQKEVIDNIKRFCTSNEWNKYYEISSCRNHILDILKGGINVKD